MADDKPKYLVEELPEEVKQAGRLPVVYYQMQHDPSKLPSYRQARSESYRASAFHCMPFEKPISRCIKLDQL
jgi:hypothetical protein